MPPNRKPQLKTAPSPSGQPATVPAKRAKTKAKLPNNIDKDCTNAVFQCPNPLCCRTFPSATGIGLHYLRHTMCHKVVAAQLTQKSYERGIEAATTTNVHAGTEQQNETQQEANDNEVDSVVASSDDGVAGDEAMAGTTTVAASAEDYGTCFTLEDQKQIELLKMLNDAHAPHYLFESINDWASKAHTSGYQFNPEHRTRVGQVKYMEDWQNLSKCQPFQSPITFPEDGLSVNVTAWGFYNTNPVPLRRQTANRKP
jgi:hypothetical protein